MKTEEFIRLSGTPREKVGFQRVLYCQKLSYHVDFMALMFKHFGLEIYPSGHFKAEKNTIFKDHRKRLI